MALVQTVVGDNITRLIITGIHTNRPNSQWLPRLNTIHNLCRGPLRRRRRFEIPEQTQTVPDLLSTLQAAQLHRPWVLTHTINQLSQQHPARLVRPTLRTATSAAVAAGGANGLQRPHKRGVVVQEQQPQVIHLRQLHRLWILMRKLNQLSQRHPARLVRPTL